MARARVFSEVPGSQLPDRFSGFFRELTAADPETKNGRLGSETEVGLVGKPISVAGDTAAGPFRYGSFMVQVYLSDLKERPCLETPISKSWVLSSYAHAERFYRGEVKGPTPSLSEADVKQLFEHEMGHYRIGRLIALDLYRTLCEQADSFSAATSAEANQNFNKWVEDYRVVRSLIQYAYDIGTDGGRNRANQLRWQNEIIAKSERMADPAANNPAYRHTPALWPGLEYTLAATPAGAPAADRQLAGELMTVYAAGSTMEIDRARAERFRDAYKNKYDAIKDGAGGGPGVPGARVPVPVPGLGARP